MPQSTGLQRVGHDLATEYTQFIINISVIYLLSIATWKIILKHNGLK